MPAWEFRVDTRRGVKERQQGDPGERERERVRCEENVPDLNKTAL